MKNVWMYTLLLATLVVTAFASEGCRIERIVWTGDHSDADDAAMNIVVGMPCDSWKSTAEKLVSEYENQGFISAVVDGIVDSAGVLSVEFRRGPAFVWAGSENLDSSGTMPEVFRKLAGLTAGDLVRPLDLERAENRLARLGYFEQTAPAVMFRDPTRNRIVPAFSMRGAAVSEAQALLTYSSQDNVWEGSINVSLYNILGTARDLEIDGFTSEDSRRLEGSYKEPWILGTEWNLVARGYFDEDSSTREAYGEIGITRDIGFDFSIGVFVGVGDNEKTSSLEIAYVSLDRFALPRSGTRIKASAIWNMARPDSLDHFLRVKAGLTKYVPVYKNWIVRAGGQAGGIFATDALLDRSDYFALGGMNDFKGMDYRFLRTRAYGYSEFALLWQDGYNLSIEAFYQPGLYRELQDDHGWKEEHEYGLAFTQYRKNWSVNLYYALRNGENYMDGIIGIGVKTLF
ncbi:MULTISPECIES: BamA/TamA family outer membrane protein [unclassified Fibrobacter]|uniref:BamA/TamA family outer membrane protein n=1 Tax=unclassified Fibrobacter TaxID=2634177 RepID=UPI000D6AADBA|nr:MULTISPECIES: BamA/TamA family outer membrane protein [unclassified Fibrobacter]PWJ71895.1 surface antigen-like protein [Fibrobacter sp. UWR4]PZW73809.1 surface antigen-like protein [Fibrobacter sp. UWR1]